MGIAAGRPSGLDGRVREAPGMYVTADADLPVPTQGKQTEYLADVRTAVRDRQWDHGNAELRGHP
ncbi:hypothetical protein [Streptomyces sp. NEAU-YJ-81]|uniref:hypothetical protein n=1 Tax=Streptomyces sp. NEAU-YJ-81 TaxID=2820288 RepID=UPI001ABD1E40|nr:hypothetical protein [Streptomyces sp. NEAU-YJ-81]MBO3680474.1 hypothetical protein [Streptomyces sp. NEAU-YJ-81]